MKLAAADLRSLAERASDAARAAGAFIARERPQHIDYKATPGSPAAQIVTEVDRRAEQMILASLAPTVEAFDLGVLTEEQPDGGSRLRADQFWCVDPLDGTLPFVEGTAGFAVSIALVGRDAVPLIGVVYDPANDTLYRAIRGRGLARDDRPWAATTGATTAVFLDRSAKDDAAYARVIAALGDDVTVHTGAGAVMNACQALASPPACYFKFPKPSGGGSLWDFAATACLFREAGAIATDMSGAPLDLNRPDSTAMNHRGVLFATDAKLAARIRRV